MVTLLKLWRIHGRVDVIWTFCVGILRIPCCSPLSIGECHNILPYKKVRPPLSKVWDFSERDTRNLLTSEEKPLAVLSANAKELLANIRQHYDDNGCGLNVSSAGVLLRITSKRQLQQLSYHRLAA